MSSDVHSLTHDINRMAACDISGDTLQSLVTRINMKFESRITQKVLTGRMQLSWKLLSKFEDLPHLPGAAGALELFVEITRKLLDIGDERNKRLALFVSSIF